MAAAGAEPGAVSGMREMVNAMTVDVEDYFQVSAFEGHIARESWDRLACRVPGNLAQILDLFDRHGVRATFFTLGWIAERYPDWVRELTREGHEVASHGYGHARVTSLSPRAFRRDVAHTKGLLEDITGEPVKGYRAPSYSICENSRWALDVLEEEGHLYSSSVYPVRHDHYGMPDAPRHPFRPAARGRLLEVPVATVPLPGRTLPCGGGGFFRLYPYPFSRWALRRINGREGRAGVFYFHPWEIDPGQPRVEGLPLRTRIRHYLNLGRMETRLERLLEDFSWDRMDRVFLGAGEGAEA